MDAARDRADTIGKGPRERSTRAVPVVVLLALLLVIGALVTAVIVLDHRVRTLERSSVDACAHRADQAVSLANRQVDDAYDYFRGSLETNVPLRVREGIFRVISRSAHRATRTMRSARHECAQVSVLGVHRSLTTERSACLRFLDAQTSYLTTVAADGSTLLSPPLPRTSRAAGCGG
jgi:hypothetical protein